MSAPYYSTFKRGRAPSRLRSGQQNALCVIRVTSVQRDLGDKRLQPTGMGSSAGDGNMLKTLIAVIRIGTEEWMVKRTVDALHDLDDRTLKDIGITRSEVESAARWRRRNLVPIGTVHTELLPGRR
jgi:uncharacterized protein YjiS (DUF1127 family)